MVPSASCRAQGALGRTAIEFASREDLYQVMKMKLQLIATNTTDHTITVAIDGVRYEYWLRGNFEAVEHTLRRMIKNGAHGRALNLLKSWSRQEEKSRL